MLDGLEEIYEKHQALSHLGKVSRLKCTFFHLIATDEGLYVGRYAVLVVLLDGPTNYLQWFICLNSLLIGTKPFEAGI